ncbi:hypothetical protein VSU19_00435 [Verrucomicrobiales bacterium BCK34]|nr:hypothetical protein [Verrucomicrobiales bacterium BCK34]
MLKPLFVLLCFLSTGTVLSGADFNQVILDHIAKMPKGGQYASYRKDLPKGQEFRDLNQTVIDMQTAMQVDRKGRVRVDQKKAANYSFCSSATYLLFCDVVSTLQQKGFVPANVPFSTEMTDLGAPERVIQGELDGIGMFGHWNADGPGTAMLFRLLNLGPNFSSYERARPGDFLKIFWNDSIGKGERGHLVVYLGENKAGNAIQVWSSNLSNDDGTSGYGTMWVEKSRIKRALFSRFEEPVNLMNWITLKATEKKSEYLIRIRETGSTGEEMKAVTGALD